MNAARPAVVISSAQAPFDGGEGEQHQVAANLRTCMAANRAVRQERVIGSQFDLHQDAKGRANDQRDEGQQNPKPWDAQTDIAAAQQKYGNAENQQQHRNSENGTREQVAAQEGRDIERNGHRHADRDPAGVAT